MKKFTFSISLILMMLAATLFAQRSDKDLVSKDNPTNNQFTLKDDVGHEISCCSSNHFKTPDTNSKDDKNLVVMWDYGPFITHPLLGPGFTDYSFLQDTSLGMETIGYGGQISAGNSIADDFVLSGSCSVSQIVFYAYQTGSGPPSTLNDIRVQIYDGDPSAGGQVVWGDFWENILLSTEWTGAFRVRESDINQNRPIMRVIAETEGLSLGSGTYWVRFSVGGTGSSGPWIPPVTILKETTTGNALQYTSNGWAPLTDIGPQGFPFRIEGYTTPMVDISLTAINKPESGFNLTNTEEVLITLSNDWFNAQPQYNIPIEAYFNGPTGWGMFRDTVPGPLLPDSTLEATLSQFVDFSVVGDYAIQVSAMLPGDWCIYNNTKTKFVTNYNGQPNIEVNPFEFEEIHFDAPQLTTQTLSISNTGIEPLTWWLDMGENLRVSGREQINNAREKNRAVIWDNGPIITAQGVGSNGSDYSELQDASLGMGTYGSGCQISAENTLADDFEITAGWHNLYSITFYAYQTGSGPPSTINDVRFQIYDGDPSAGGEVIFGDLTTNRLLLTQWANVWRVLESGPTENRPVMEIIADASCCYLTAGNYWVEFQAGGTGSSGPWCPAVSIPGETNTGNAMQYNATSQTWEPLMDVGPQGFPFVVDAYLGGAENDVGITAILEPASGVSYTNEEAVTIRLENFGAADQSDIPFEVSWSGPTGSETVNGVYGGYLMCGQYVDITLDETADLSAPGTYIFEACSLLEGDENPDNDCKTKGLSGPLPGNDWLWFDIFSGVINPGDTTFVTLNFDSEIVEPGQYQDTITIHSNDPDQAIINIPVALNVIYELIPPANLSAEHLGMGEVQLCWVYYPTKDLEHFNIYRNDIQIGTVQDTTFTDNLPEFGIYTYTVTAQYTQGESEPAGPVEVEWIALPIIELDPLEISETHPCSELSSMKLFTISNLGDLTLIWELAFGEKAKNRNEISIIPEGKHTSPAVANGFMDYSWLSVNYSTGSIEPGQSEELVFTFNSVGLEPDTYIGEISITSNDLNNPLVEIPVELLVEEAEITYTWNPESFEFVFSVDSEIDYLEIENTGSDTLQIDFEIEYLDEGKSSKDSWLSINLPTASIAPGNNQVFEVIVDVSYLMWQHSEANIILNTGDPCFPTQQIPVTVDIVGSIDETGQKAEISISPNPVDNMLNINAEVVMVKLVLSNQFGQVVLERAIGGRNAKLNTSNLPGGVYLLIVYHDDLKSVHKVVIR